MRYPSGGGQSWTPQVSQARYSTGALTQGAAKVYGKLAQQTSETITKYYYFGGKRIAMRVGTTLTYLHSDHLGSASLATIASGAVVANSEQRYTPFGSSRLNASGLPTNRRFNGMKEESALGGIFGDFCEASPNEVSGAMRDLEFILSEAKEHRDRAVLERGYDH
jgi:hypothetical protein